MSESDIKEWWTTQELLGAGDLPTSVEGLIKRAQREAWPFRKRETGKGFEYHISSLPESTRVALVLAAQPQREAPAAPESATTANYCVQALWQRYEKVTADMRNSAQLRVAALRHFYELTASGLSKTDAMAATVKEHGFTRPSLYRWLKKVQSFHRSDWAAVLVSDYKGIAKNADFSKEAWEFLKADYLRLEKPALAACYHRLQRAAAEHGWQIPTLRTVERWVDKKIDLQTKIFKREGELALMTRFPAMQRTVMQLYATQAINGDGYQHNVFVKFSDGVILRPKTWFWQDVFSRKILAYRVDESENTDTIRLSFGDLVEQFGIPEHVTIDNTRAAANKVMTGGNGQRHRGIVKEEDPDGIFKLLNIDVHWTSINRAGTQAKGHGQAKPIERAFGIGGLGEYVDKHPAFAGAYTGENPTAKPENYGKTAIPVETFVAVLNQEIIAWNAKSGRRTEMAMGMHSFDQVFEHSYAQAPIRKATAEQRRLWLLASEAVTVKKDGTFTLAAGAKVGQGSDGRNRYYAPELQAIGELKQKIVVRFEPYQLHEKVYAYTLDGRFIAEALCQEAFGFYDTAAGRAYNKARRQFIKAAKQAAHAELKMDMAELQKHLPKPELPSDAEAKVVRPARTSQFIEPPPAPDVSDKVQAGFARIQQLEANAKTQVEESPRQRYARWLTVDQKAKGGDALTEHEKRWHEIYQTTGEYKIQQQLANDFGLGSAAI